MWPQIIIAIVMIIISEVLRPSTTDTSGTTAGTLDVPTTDAGTPVAVAFGTNLQKSAVIAWYGDASTTPIKSGGAKK